MGQPEYPHADITESIIGAAMKVHTALGQGLLENCYRACVAHEIVRRGLRVEQELVVPVRYDDITIDTGLRLDLLVEKCVVVELKAIDRLLPIHEAQLHTYLRLTNCSVGLLINFNVQSLRDGIKRRILTPRSA